MRLYPVKVTKTMSCLTYALKRAGIKLHSLIDAWGVEHYFIATPIAQHITSNGSLNVAKGTLLMYCASERVEQVPTEITEEGMIIYQSNLVLRHIAVYEGNGLISDCTISSKNYPFCKHVRMQRFEELPEGMKPTHVLTLKPKYIDSQVEYCGREVKLKPAKK